MKLRRIILILLFSAFAGIDTLHGAGKYSLKQLERTNPELAVSYVFNEGVKYYLTGNQPGAKSVFSGIIKKHPDHAPSYFYLARIEADGQNLDKAIEYIKKASNLDKDNSQYLEFLGRLLLETENLEEARGIYDTLLSMHPEEGENYILAAAIAKLTGDFNRALELANIYEDRWGTDPRAVDIKQDALTELKLYEEAEQYLLKLTDAYPSEAMFRAKLAGVQEVNGKDSLMFESLQKLIEIDPQDFRGYIALSEYYRIKGRFSEWLSTLEPVFSSPSVTPEEKASHATYLFFDQALYSDYPKEVETLATSMKAAHPDDTTALDIYGAFLIFTQRVDEARQHYADIMNSGHISADIYKSVISIELYARNQPDSAMYYIDRAIDAYPSHFGFYLYKSIVNNKLQQADESLRALKMADKYAADSLVKSDIYTMIGDINHQQGHTKESFKAYREAIKYNPDNSGALNNYAYYLSIRNKDMDRALFMARRANEITSSNPTFLDTLAWVLHVMGRNEEALSVMRQAIALDDKIPELLYHYAEILYAAGEDFLARTYWKLASEAGYDQNAIDERMKLPVKDKDNKDAE